MPSSELVFRSILADRFGASPEEQRKATSSFFRRAVASGQVLADFVTSAAGVYLAYSLYFSLHIGKHVKYKTDEVLVVACVIGVLIAVLLERDGAYRGGNSLLKIRETVRAIRVPGQTLFLILPITYLLGRSFSRWALVFSVIVVPFLLVIQKTVFSAVVRILHRKGLGVERVVIYGAGYTGRRVLSALLHSPVLGLSPILMLDDNPSLNASRVYELGYRRTRSVEVRSGPITQDILKSCQCDKLIIAIPNLPQWKFVEVALAAKQTNVQVVFLPGEFVQEHYWTESIDVDGLMLTSLGPVASDWRYEITKRAVDILAAVLFLVLLSPALGIVAFLILLDSPGPVLFTQTRVGKNGRLFNMYKFRSMHTNTPKYGKSPTASADPRITRVGRWLRKTSLDEIPQLINVLKGNMSLVGPRPEMPFIVEGYDLRQRQRLQVTPGITGLWQLSADRAFHIHENIHYDLYYIRHRSFFMDLAILVHTAFFAMRGV